jgi:hypothetical protein
MPLAGFEPTIPASERPQTHASDRATTGIGGRENYIPSIKFKGRGPVIAFVTHTDIIMKRV